jgi:hypothetical protein
LGIRDIGSQGARTRWLTERIAWLADELATVVRFKRRKRRFEFAMQTI